MWLQEKGAKLADLLFLGSVSTWLAANIATIDQFLQAASFLAVIFSGIFAARYHWKRTEQLKRLPRRDTE